jgi:hypothetical protein
VSLLQTARDSPQTCSDADGDVHILRKDCKFAKPQPLFLGYLSKADINGLSDRPGAFCFIARVEGDESLGVELVVRVCDRG